MGPAGMKPEVVANLNRAIVQSLNSADLRAKLAQNGGVATPTTPEELRKRYEEWSRIFGRIAKEAGLKPQ
jgi:tripartite-type tricarboxylate transporter receptor subunit TctC